MAQQASSNYMDIRLSFLDCIRDSTDVELDHVAQELEHAQHNRPQDPEYRSCYCDTFSVRDVTRISSI